MPQRVDYDEIKYELWSSLFPGDWHEVPSGEWVDVSEDVVGTDKGEMGIQGWGPLDRVASAGTFTFSLKNNFNYYTPNHTSCIIDNLGPGTPFRLVFKTGAKERTRFYGEIPSGGIKIDSSTLYSSVTITVTDYFEKLAEHELGLLEFAENKRIDEIVPLIITDLLSPQSAEYNTGQDTFPTVFDTVTSHALQELSKLANSELGYIYLKQSPTSDEVLAVEGRYTKAGAAVAEVTIDDGVGYPEYHDAIFDCSDLQGDAVSFGENYYNHVKTTTYPRRVGETDTEVLFTLNRYLAIDDGETAKIIGRYIDPDQEAVSIAGIDMQVPVATTDYLMNTASDGSGTDKTSDLVVSATYGTNGVEYELTNNSGGIAYVTFLQARGRGVYTYRPVEYEVKNDTEITNYGKKTLELRLPYHSNPLIGEDFAKNILDIYGSHRTTVESISLIANADEFLLNAFLDLQVRDKIRVTIAQLSIDNEFFIQSIQWSTQPGGVVLFSYGLQPANVMPSSSYWFIGEAGFSEIGETTVLGF